MTSASTTSGDFQERHHIVTCRSRNRCVPDAAPPSSLATVGDCAWTKCHPRPVCGPR